MENIQKGVTSGNSSTEYDEMLDYFYQNIWPVLSTCCGESITLFMGDRRLGLWGSFKKEEKGETIIKFLAEQIAKLKDYSILTGKGIFKTHLNMVVLFPILIHLAPTVIGVEKFYQWLVRLVFRSIVVLGKSKTTAVVEEKESLESGKPTLGLAIIRPVYKPNSCKFLQEHAIKNLNFSVCKGRVAACPRGRGKYCPFFKVGTPYGRLDLYTRKKNGTLLAVDKKESAFAALGYIGFI